MYQALYRKYRPTTFSDVVGQSHITDTLKNELSEGKISHAYLFTGTRGTGKTTCAKILAKAVNCLDPKNGDPCGECESCKAISAGEVMDIVELDAASNNGVDDVRELREQVSFTPAKAKYRVYIIDEVHMLSKAAFNALLKTLEEPPAHVIFILATTEVNELPATILSRCQRFDFRRIDAEDICSRLRFVAESEGLKLTDDAASLIASLADGGMRDALSILDLCAASGCEITENAVSDVCGMAGNEYLFELSDHIRNHDTEKALMLIDRLHSSSVDMTRLLGDLIKHYRNIMIMKTISLPNKPIVCSKSQRESLERQARFFELKDVLFALDLLGQTLPRMKNSDRRSEMEMAVIKLCNPKLAGGLLALEARVSALESGAVTAQPIVMNEQPEDIPVPDNAPDEAEQIPDEPESQSPENTAEADSSDDEQPIKEWNEILDVLMTSNRLLCIALRGSRAFVRGNYLLIDSQSTQFKDIMNGSAHSRESLKKAIASVLGKVYNIGPYHRVDKAQEKADPLAAFAEKLNLLEK